MWFVRAPLELWSSEKQDVGIESRCVLVIFGIVRNRGGTIVVQWKHCDCPAYQPLWFHCFLPMKKKNCHSSIPLFWPFFPRLSYLSWTKGASTLFLYIFGNFVFVFLWVFVFWYLVDHVLLIMIKVGQMERALSLILSYHALGNPPLFSAHWVLYLRNIILHRGDYQVQHDTHIWFRTAGALFEKSNT